MLFGWLSSRHIHLRLQSIKLLKNQASLLYVITIGNLEIRQTSAPPPPMRVPGKRTSRLTVNTVSAGNKNNLFFLSDKKSGQWYLVDTGAQISVIPASHFDRFNHKLTHLLVAANGTSIKTYGTRIVPLNFNQRNFNGVLQLLTLPTHYWVLIFSRLIACLLTSRVGD